MTKLLDGFCILVLEDEYLGAIEIRDMIEDLGGKVIGPAGRLDQARSLVETDPPHAAILDVKLNGSTSFDFADELRARNIPVIFVTGYGEELLPDRFREMPHLSKPVGEIRLERAVRRAFLAGANEPCL